MEKLSKFISSNKAKYLWATLIIIAWVLLSLLWRYPARVDIVLTAFYLISPVFIIWCLIGIFSLKWLPVWPHRIVFAVGLLILAWITLYQINWRPDGLLRTPPPWQAWHIPTEPQQKSAYDFAHSLKTPDDFKDDGFIKKGYSDFLAALLILNISIIFVIPTPVNLFIKQ